MSNNLLYNVAIEMIPMIGSITAKRLISYCGSAEEIFKLSKQELLKIPNIGTVLSSVIVDNKNVLKRAEEELLFTEKNGIKILFYQDNDYPKYLKQCDDAPIVLYQKGDVDFNIHDSISIVGTRNCTSYGIEMCEKLIEDIASRGHKPIIVSGMAYGIDVCAHKKALKSGLKTVAVTGTGLDMIYPAAHAAIAKQILDNGAVVSDFPSKTKIDRKNFIRRNRIIAGLAKVTIVVESGEKGGALITADIASSYNRDVLAFPGKVSDKYSVGCNCLIKNNVAGMITSIDDLESIMGWSANGKDILLKQLPLPNLLTDEERCIIDILKENNSEVIDAIAYKTGIPMAKLSALLLNLEFLGYIKVLPGKIYSLSRVNA